MFCGYVLYVEDLVISIKVLEYSSTITVHNENIHCESGYLQMMSGFYGLLHSRSVEFDCGRKREHIHMSQISKSLQGIHTTAYER